MSHFQQKFLQLLFFLMVSAGATRWSVSPQPVLRNVPEFLFKIIFISFRRNSIQNFCFSDCAFFLCACVCVSLCPGLRIIPSLTVTVAIPTGTACVSRSHNSGAVFHTARGAL